MAAGQLWTNLTLSRGNNFIITLINYHPRRNPRPYRAETSPKHVMEDFKNILLFYNLLLAGLFSARGELAPPPKKHPAHIGQKLHQNMSRTILRTFYFFAIYSEWASSLPKKNPPWRNPRPGVACGALGLQFWGVQIPEFNVFGLFWAFSLHLWRFGALFHAQTPQEAATPAYIRLKLYQNMFWTILRTFHFLQFILSGREPPGKAPAQIGLKLHQNMFWTILRTFHFL